MALYHEKVKRFGKRKIGKKRNGKKLKRFHFVTKMEVNIYFQFHKNDDFLKFKLFGLKK